MGISVDIKKKYDDFTLDVSFESSSNRIGILGASGCGKSLTLKSIAGLIKPDSGSVIFDKRILYDSGRKINIRPQERSVGYLFQDYALFPNMTVEENIETALRGASGTRKRAEKNNTGNTSGVKKDDSAWNTIEDILGDFGLHNIRDHRPDKISGGQKQRTALARMLACDPSLLLLDEPFSAMDTYLREGMRLELIRRLNMYNKTVIIVSHDRDEIYQMCNYLVLMDKGRVIDRGSTDELFEHPKSSASARLTGCKNISRIERISEHRIRALDWKGIELVTDMKVEKGMTHAGIRAHDFTPGEHGVNVIDTGQAMISRLPFEWYVTLENGLWWKLPRELDRQYTSDIVPRYVSVEPEKIILMKG